jgi:hypothetical protein
LRPPLPRSVVAVGFAAAAALRLGYLVASPPNWDTEAYAELARTLDSGGTLYRDTPRYNYSPVWALVVRALSRIAGPLGVPLHRAVGGLLLLADAATALLLYRIARDVLARPPDHAAGAALLFFANPVSVFVTGFHAQFDGLAILFLLGAVWLEGRRPSRPAAATGALAGSLLVKHVTAFHPLLFARQHASRGGEGLPLAAVFVPYAVFVASFLPYWNERAAVRERVLGYGSLAEDYGTAMLKRLPGVPDWLPTALFFAAAFVAALVFARLEPARASLSLFLVLLVFLPGVAEYYFVWPIAFGSLFGGAGYALYTLLVSAFFLGSPDGLGLPITHLPGWHGVWWGAVFWLLWELRRVQGPKSKVQSPS